MEAQMKCTVMLALLICAITVAESSAGEYANAMQREHEEHILYDVEGKPYVADPSLKNRLNDYEAAYAREDMIPDYAMLYRDKDREAYTQLAPLPLAEQFLYTPQEYVTPEMAEKMAEAYEQWKPSRVGFEPAPELQRVYYDKPYGSSWRIPSWQRVKRNLGFETPRAEEYTSAWIPRESVYGPRGEERDRELTAAWNRKIDENLLNYLGYIPEPIKEQTFWGKVKTVWSNLWSREHRAAAYNALTDPYSTIGEKIHHVGRELMRQDYMYPSNRNRPNRLYGHKNVLYPDAERVIITPKAFKRKHKDMSLVLPTKLPVTTIIPEENRPARTLFPEQHIVLPKARNKKSTLY
jgi:hypothetical protein